MEKYKPYIYLEEITKGVNPPEYLLYRLHYKFELGTDEYVQRVEYTPVSRGRSLREIKFLYKKLAGGSDAVSRDHHVDIKSSEIFLPEYKVKVVLESLDHHVPAHHDGSSVGHFGDAD